MLLFISLLIILLYFFVGKILTAGLASNWSLVQMKLDDGEKFL